MLKDWKTILPVARACHEDGQRFAIATVVGIQGSAYRGLGSRMLIGPKGETTGLISGGCLEADVAQHALEVMESGNAKLVTYDSQSNQDLIWGLGLGCGGVIRILIEKADSPGHRPWFSGLHAAIEAGKACVLAGTFDPSNPKSVMDLGTLLMIEGEIAHQTIQDGHLAEQVAAEAARLHRNMNQRFDFPIGRVKSMTTPSSSCQLLLQPLAPPPSLVVCGGGIDAEPIVTLSQFLGWETTLALPRPSPLPHKRWAGPPKTVVTAPENVLEALPIHSRSCVLIMSHHYQNDRHFLANALQSPATYIGILGPKRRTLQLLSDLKSEGMAVDTTRLFYPMGLDIGAEAPEEIALSILAEIRAFIANRQGGHLKFRKGAIHYR